MDAAACLTRFDAGGRSYVCYSIAAAERRGLEGAASLPFSAAILLENVLRQRAAGDGCDADLRALCDRTPGAFVRVRPARIMMDDTAGLPLLGELAAMRDAAAAQGAGAQAIDLQLPVDFIVDHSVSADHTAAPDALARNMALEMARNAERFQLMRWAEQAFPRLRVVPPGRGIAHQINLECLARVVCSDPQGDRTLAYPDMLIGIDSHTPMSNALGMVAWGTSGMEGLAAALGCPVTVPVPEVLGCRLTGALRAGVTATDLVLTLTRELRSRGVVGKVVEYFGPGLSALTLPDRATVANMTPEAGATMSYFPIDAETIRYLRATGRSAGHLALVEAYARLQGLWHEAEDPPRAYAAQMTFDLGAVEPSVSGPRLPHQRIALSAVPQAFDPGAAASVRTRAPAAGLRDGDVVLAAITSCTNTSNPALMIGAGLLARNAVRRGLRVPPWVKTSLSPGSRVVADYLQRSGLQSALDVLGFQVTGYGCMTCVGFSGPLPDDVTAALRDRGVRAAAVYSGNRNYEGRAHPLIRSSFLASPPLVVAYALCGSILRDLTREPLARDPAGRPVFLEELWPQPREVQEIIDATIRTEMFRSAYADLRRGTPEWQALRFPSGAHFQWRAGSTFIQRPRTYDAPGACTLPGGALRARILALYGDMVTTEHISPMGTIPADGAAAEYLRSLGIAPRDFVSYAARRLNDEVMTRGALSSPHLANEMTPGERGGMTRHMPSGALMSIHDAAQRYRREGVPLVVIAGHAFGAGSSRDWAAKGLAALGVRAVIAAAYERIYRSNRAAAGVLPLQFAHGTSRRTLGLDGTEEIAIEGLDRLAPGAAIGVVFSHAQRAPRAATLIARVETGDEVEHIRQGGLLPSVLRRLLA
jgi:aconitate hydratase